MVTKYEWDRLLRERNEWVAHNFPYKGGDYIDCADSLSGMIEEVGELAHAHLKEKQNIRGTAEEHQAAAKDSIGDLIIYSLGVMNYLDQIPRGAGIRTPPRPDIDTDQLLHKIAVFMARCVEAPAMHHLILMIQAAERYCAARGWDFRDIVISTWEKVSKRDWIEDPEEGGGHV